MDPSFSPFAQLDLFPFLDLSNLQVVDTPFTYQQPVTELILPSLLPWGITIPPDVIHSVPISPLQVIHSGTEKLPRTQNITKKVPVRAEYLKCCSCEHWDTDAVSMGRHRRDKHPELFIYKCDKCDYTARSTKKLLRHKGIHQRVPYHCSICSYYCVARHTLHRHLLYSHDININ